MSVLKIAPDFAQRSEVLYRLAVVFGKSYQLDQAINYFKLATMETNDGPTIKRRMDILIKMGICYIEKKEYVEALRCFESALLLNNQDFHILQHIAWCEFSLRRNSQALDHINKAIALKDSDGDSYYIKGRILLDMGEHLNATENFKKAIACNPNKVEYLASLAILNALNKEYKEAFDNFLKATQLAPTCPEIWYDIGLLYETHQQYKEALTAYQKSTEIDSAFNEAIVRKQILSNQLPPKPPTPPYIHPEFRVFDNMVPHKSFLANLKVKKAIEPSFDSSATAQPSAIIKSIFSNNSQANPCLLPVPSNESGGFSLSKPNEEVKLISEEAKHFASCEMESSFPDKQSIKEATGRSKIELKSSECISYKPNVSLIPTETNIPLQHSSDPSAAITKGTVQSPPVDTTNLQFQSIPQISPTTEQQRMDLLRKCAQIREHQLQLDNMLRSCGLVPSTIDNSSLQNLPPTDRLSQPLVDTSSLMNVGRVGQSSNESFSMFKEFSPQAVNSQVLPQINFGITPIRPIPFYGTSANPSYELRSEVKEEDLGPKKPVAQHPTGGLLRPIPMLPQIDRHTTGIDKNKTELRSGGLQEGTNNDFNTMVRLNVPSQMSDARPHKKDKIGTRGLDIEYSDVQRKRPRNE